MEHNTGQPALLASVGGGLAVLVAVLPSAREATLLAGTDLLALFVGILGVAAVALGVFTSDSQWTATIAGIGLLLTGIAIQPLLASGSPEAGFGLFLAAVAGTALMLGATYRYFDVATGGVTVLQTATEREAR